MKTYNKDVFPYVKNAFRIFTPYVFTKDLLCTKPLLGTKETGAPSVNKKCFLLLRNR